jgi:DNA-binding transcriptional ArsR family regulator
MVTTSTPALAAERPPSAPTRLFAKIYLDEITTLDAMALKILAALRGLGRGRRAVHASLAAIAEAAGCSVRTVRRWLPKLQSAGLVDLTAIERNFTLEVDLTGVAQGVTDAARDVTGVARNVTGVARNAPRLSAFRGAPLQPPYIREN